MGNVMTETLSVNILSENILVQDGLYLQKYMIEDEDTKHNVGP